MQWFWVAGIVGILAPLITMRHQLLSAFRQGVGVGIATWAGMCVITVPLVLLGAWIARALL